MLILEFFGWWYTSGWKKLLVEIAGQIKRLWYVFSVPTLLKTLFAPWKRIVTVPGKTLQDRLRAVGDNIISRLVGLVVRIFVIIAAIVVISVVTALGLAVFVIWPLVPPGTIVIFARGLV